MSSPLLPFIRLHSYLKRSAVYGSIPSFQRKIVGKCSLTALPTSTARPFSANGNPSKQPLRPAPIPNPALAQIKALGMPHLEATTVEIISKTRQPLFLPPSEMGPSPDQLAEAHRINTVLSQVLDNFSKRDATFSIKGEPIVIMEVEVSKDLKQARVYYALPFNVLKYPKQVVQEVYRRMQELLEKRGGKLQRLVHVQLRSYYPPKLRFVPYDDNLLKESLK